MTKDITLSYGNIRSHVCFLENYESVFYSSVYAASSFTAEVLAYKALIAFSLRTKSGKTSARDGVTLKNGSFKLEVPLEKLVLRNLKRQ